MPRARVSVLLPVRDGTPFLARALDSVLGQTYRDLELVVLDDGSSDATPELLAAAAASDPRVRVERRERIGLTAALNELVALAHGEVLVRMDADDVSLPDRVERQLAFLDAHPEVALVGGAVVLVDAQGGRLGTVRYPPEPEAVRQALGDYNCIPHAAVAVRAGAVREAGGYRLERAQDYDLWLRLAERHRLANLADPVLLLRQHGGQISERDLELQVLSSLVARAAARARSRGEVDPLEGGARVDRDLALRLGISPAAVDEAVVDAYVTLAAARETAGDRAAARELLAAASRLAPAERVRVAAALRAARNAAAAGRLLAAVRAAGPPAARHPIVAVREARRALRRGSLVGRGR